MIGDPYFYPGTEVLQNKEDIRDADELDRFERVATAARMETLPDALPITHEGYRAIHRYIFQDVYDWAGEDRTVDIAKGNSYFCRSAYINQELEKCFQAIRVEDNLRGLSAEKFAARATEYLSTLNAIHPFREGNGRTQRMFLVILGQQAGHSVDLQRIAPEAWNQASRESFLTGDCRRLHDVVAGTLATDREGLAPHTDRGNAPAQYSIHPEKQAEIEPPATQDQTVTEISKGREKMIEDIEQNSPPDPPPRPLKTKGRSK